MGGRRVRQRRLLVWAALTVPVPQWRAGEMPQTEQQYRPPAHATTKPTWVWIDADDASETGNRRDPDNCLALLSRATVS